MTTQLIPVFSGSIQGQPVQLVDARVLHSFMEVARDFSNWIKKRIADYGFTKDQDFIEVFAKSGENLQGGRPAIEYHLVLDMAKELAMVERNEKGRQARRYFIEMERQALLQRTGNIGQLPSLPEPPTITKAQKGEIFPEITAPTGSPFDNVESSKLAGLLRISRASANAYLVLCGVTPGFIASTLAEHRERSDESSFLHPGLAARARAQGSIAEWYYECLQRGSIIGAEAGNAAKWPTEMDTKYVQAAYTEWGRAHRLGYIHSKTVLGIQLSGWGITKRRPRKEAGDRPRNYVFPSLEKARQLFADVLAGYKERRYGRA